MKTFTIGATALLFSMLGAAQKLNLDFSRLAAQAKEKAEVDLDGAALAALQQKQAIKNTLSGVTGVFVRHYEFAAAGAYSDSDLDPLRRQAEGDPAWSRIVSVKESAESTQIFILKTGVTPGGLLVISAEPKEVTVVEILGTVDLAHLQEVVKSTISYDLKSLGAEPTK
ncbi:MAG TPA: DUF4252 domain-containing protein [Bryobacteraceae bacterium]|jgi:hypothetical protein